MIGVAARVAWSERARAIDLVGRAPTLLGPFRCTGVLAAALAVSGWTLGSPAVAVVAPSVFLLVVRERSSRRSAAVEARLVADLPHRVDEILLGVRSGLGLGSACALVAHGDHDMDEAETSARRALNPLARSSTEPITLRRAAARLRTASRPGVRLIGVTVETLAELGGPSAPALTRLRHTLAGVVYDRQRREAEAAQAEASAGLLSAVPLVFAGFVAAVDHDVARFYLFHTGGTGCLLVAVGLGYAGRRWMSRVTRADDRTGIASRRPDDRPSLDDLVSTIDVTSVVIGAGGTVADAVRALQQHGPPAVAPVFGEVVDRWQDGMIMADAVASSTDQLGPDFHPLVGALLTTETGGAPVGGLLHRLADDADHARRRAAEARAAQLPARLVVPLVVCHLPAVIVGALVPVLSVSVGRLAL